MPSQDEIRRGEVIRELPTTQSATAHPVTSSPHLPAMEKIGAVATVLRNPILPLMGAGVPQHTAGIGTMDAVPKRTAPFAELSGKPQEPKPGPPPGVASNDGYVRMEIHVDNGKLSVSGVKHVLGPLALPSALTRGYSYEVLLNDQQVGLGSLPDVGVMRAFANRDVEGPQGKHHFAKLPTFDFSVRIPAGYVVAANLPKLNIVLHNVEEAPDRLTSLAPLGRQPAVKTVEVGRLTGIKLEDLSPNVRPHLEQILKRE
jgi:hypothetical protein